VYPVNGVFDFSKDLNTLISPPPTKAVTLTMRCGGFSGDALIDLGVGQQTIQPNSNNQPFTLSGQGFTLTATLNFGQAQVSPPVVKVVRAQPPEQVIPPAYDVAVVQPRDATEPTLLWRWRPVTCPPDAGGQPPADCKYVNDITGFRVRAYQIFAMDPNAQEFELTPDQKQFKLPPLPADVSTMCYSVVAYKGDLVSEIIGTSQACYGNPNFPTPPLPSANISAPTNLKLTSDINECQSHQITKPVLWNDQDCQKLTNSSPAVVWDWSNTLCQPGEPGCEAIADIEGYNIYRVSYAKSELAITITSASTTAIVLTYYPGGDSVSICYVVRAFKGSLESGPSNRLCLSPADLGVNSFSLLPTGAYSYGSFYNRTGCNPETSQQLDSTDKGSLDPRASFNVGYIHRTFTSLSGVGTVTGCPQTTAFWREGMVDFDLTALAGRTIQKAIFEFQRGQAQNLWAADQIFPDGFLDMGLATDNDCATSLGTGVRKYAGFNIRINGDLRSSHRIGSGMYRADSVIAPAPLGTAPIDVTTLANDLLTAGKSQLSFLFATDHAHPDETKSCFSNYHGFKLTIQLAP
jgi:hypothetical protein